MTSRTSRRHGDRRRRTARRPAPSLINLSGIYFLRFGMVTTLLVDHGGAAAGMLNAMVPRLRPPKTLIPIPSRFEEKNEYNGKSPY